MWYVYDIINIYIMKYYSTMKKNGVLPFAAKITDLEIIRLSEIGQRQILCVTTYMWNLKK